MTMNKTEELIEKISDHEEIGKLDVKIEDTVSRGTWIAQEYLDTIVECLKNTHYLNDLEIQEMVDKAFHYAEQNQESA